VTEAEGEIEMVGEERGVVMEGLGDATALASRKGSVLVSCCVAVVVVVAAVGCCWGLD
jgi:hypothetical protein